METLLRDACDPADDWPAAPHACVVVDRAEEQLDRAAAWVREGLGAGDRVVYVERDGSDGEFVRGLSRKGVAWREPVRDGRLVVLPAQEALLVDGRFAVDARMARHADYVADSLRQGFKAVRMSAEAGPALGIIPDHQALLAYEEGLDELTRTMPVSVLCFYDRPAFGPGLMPFIRLHRRSVVDRQLEASCLPGRLRLVGEIDIANVDLLRALLCGTTAVAGEVVLDLSGVTFIDVTGTVAIVERAGELSPARVRVLDPPPHLMRVLTVIGGHDVLQFTYGGAKQ